MQHGMTVRTDWDQVFLCVDGGPSSKCDVSYMMHMDISNPEFSVELEEVKTTHDTDRTVVADAVISRLRVSFVPES